MRFLGLCFTIFIAFAAATASLAQSEGPRGKLFRVSDLGAAFPAPERVGVGYVPPVSADDHPFRASDCIENTEAASRPVQNTKASFHSTMSDVSLKLTTAFSTRQRLKGSVGVASASESSSFSFDNDFSFSEDRVQFLWDADKEVSLEVLAEQNVRLSEKALQLIHGDGGMQAFRTECGLGVVTRIVRGGRLRMKAVQQDSSVANKLTMKSSFSEAAKSPVATQASSTSMSGTLDVMAKFGKFDFSIESHGLKIVKTDSSAEVEAANEGTKNEKKVENFDTFKLANDVFWNALTDEPPEEQIGSFPVVAYHFLPYEAVSNYPSGGSAYDFSETRDPVAILAVIYSDMIARADDATNNPQSYVWRHCPRRLDCFVLAKEGAIIRFNSHIRPVVEACLEDENGEACEKGRDALLANEEVISFIYEGLWRTPFKRSFEDSVEDWLPAPQYASLLIQANIAPLLDALRRHLGPTSDLYQRLKPKEGALKRIYDLAVGHAGDPAPFAGTKVWCGREAHNKQRKLTSAKVTVVSHDPSRPITTYSANTDRQCPFSNGKFGVTSAVAAFDDPTKVCLKPRIVLEFENVNRAKQFRCDFEWSSEWEDAEYPTVNLSAQY